MIIREGRGRNGRGWKDGDVLLFKTKPDRRGHLWGKNLRESRFLEEDEDVDYQWEEEEQKEEEQKSKF